MKIQIISNTKNIKAEGYEVVYSELGNPQTLESFDVNIIDLQNENLWVNDSNSSWSINCVCDLKSLQINIESTKRANVIIALPQNYIFYYHESRYVDGYEDSFILKDKIENLKAILSNILPNCLKTHTDYSYSLAFENSETKCGNSLFKSAFYFSKCPYNSSLTNAQDSNKSTTIKASEKCFITTLKLGDTNCKLKDFLEALGIKDNKLNYPQWLIDFEKFDDKIQHRTIEENNLQIVELQKEIHKSQEILQKNLRLKSILTENGDNLVAVVFDILQEILSYDLSEFNDVKKEDFLIKLGKCTFIGEIKGINSNVKSENVSQLDVHYQSYLEKLDEEKITERVKALLIINSQRNKPITERDEVCETQIKLAKRNGSLIIPTITLLTIYEKFLDKQITSEQIIEIFLNQEGLIDLKI